MLLYTLSDILWLHCDQGCGFGGKMSDSNSDLSKIPTGTLDSDQFRNVRLLNLK